MKMMKLMVNKINLEINCKFKTFFKTFCTVKSQPLKRNVIEKPDDSKEIENIEKQKPAPPETLPGSPIPQPGKGLTRFDVYCRGIVLDTVQRARIFEDSKTFVDLKIAKSPEELIGKFNNLMADTQNKPTATQLEVFVQTNFESRGKEFRPWEPKDWIAKPKFIDKIKDESYKQWAIDLNAAWKNLGRKVKKDVKVDQDLYSIIYTKHGIIVPGGRFAEFYYWDAYWIVLGLLLSEMTTTVRGMLLNFIDIVRNYGFIPNGGRIYYLDRSQPPFFIPMVKAYVEKTDDWGFISENIHILEKEFNFWLTRRMRTFKVRGKEFKMAAYGNTSLGPRPESYAEDFYVSQIFSTQAEREHFFGDIKAAAESGWDFSSRWFIRKGTNKGSLRDIRCTKIIPVDLNCFLQMNAVTLAGFQKKLGNDYKAKQYKTFADVWLNNINEVFWHDDLGVWLDYDTVSNSRRDYFYMSNIIPLYTNSYKPENKDKITKSILKYLRIYNVLHAAGIPCSFEHTTEQWDYPNGWAPLNHMTVVGLYNTRIPAAMEVAFQIADRWIATNYKSFQTYGAMFEKYDATILGDHGGDGEYQVQLGFGWTNGVVIDLLNMFNTRLEAKQDEHFVV